VGETALLKTEPYRCVLVVLAGHLRLGRDTVTLGFARVNFVTVRGKRGRRSSGLEGGGGEWGKPVWYRRRAWVGRYSSPKGRREEENCGWNYFIARLSQKSATVDSHLRISEGR
jgi:hypothetical protein